MPPTPRPKHMPDIAKVFIDDFMWGGTNFEETASANALMTPTSVSTSISPTPSSDAWAATACKSKLNRGAHAKQARRLPPSIIARSLRAYRVVSRPMAMLLRPEHSINAAKNSPLLAIDQPQ